ncbi:MAG TPA: DUF742 domain-containing protein [Actinocrinis sp.]|uniref:DUF742 domain-containing protein n=1 Tax=Actinocrinis sp. TaxID=1920516 RepID=UPI002DDCC61A|nr:DUF742 domain-containing protein [Actinocrinis sp.]HEV3169103.1 DUF742 domain-containing protein [Actinocrinis sp.]
MREADPDVRFDEDAGLLVRPYAVTGGRTRPSAEFRLITLVAATGRALGDVTPEHTRILGVCRRPTSVAEISAHLRLPVAVIKILLADLLGWRAIVTRAPVAFPDMARPDRHVLEAVIDALRAL